MGLDQVGFLPDGRVVQVESTVFDTVRRLRDGDPVLGWEGDPNMDLYVDLATGLYDVVTKDRAGHDTLVVSQAPYCDQRLIERVIHADGRRFDVVERVMAQGQAAKARQEAAFHELVQERAERLFLAMRRDVGAQVGGLTRNNLLVWGGDL